MNLADDLRDLRSSASDWEGAEGLKQRFAELRAEREPFYLTREDMEAVFRWKLISQYGRGRTHRNTNSDEAYRIATQAAFSVNESDGDKDLELKVGFLTALRGVGVPVASAILALVEPDRYCVVDFRGWRAVFDQKREVFGIPQYKLYLARVREIAAELGWSPQETDLAIWELDKRRSGAA